MAFSSNLRKFRKQEGLTQNELAKQLNISRSLISYYEHGKVEPSIKTIIKLSEIFNITTDKLLKN